MTVGSDALRPLGDVLDAVPEVIVVINSRGLITYVNEAWRRFARDNGADAATIDGVGIDYLAASPRASTPSVSSIADALAEVVAGRSQSFTCVYPCHSPTEARWFQLDATRLPGDDAAILVHRNVTDHRLAEARLHVQSVVSRALADRMPLLEVCGHIMQTVCEGLEWDFAATWLPRAERLYCASSWMRPGCDVFAFNEETHTVDFERGQGLPGSVWAAVAPRWVEEVGDDPRFWRKASAGAAGLRSGFATPLGADGEVFAVVEFFSRIRRKRDAATLDLLATAGAQLGAQMQRQRSEQRAAKAETARQNVSAMLDAIITCAPVAILAVDPSGWIQFSNRTLERHERQREGDLSVDADWLRYYPPEEHEERRARLARVVDTGVAETFESSAIAPDGTRRWYSTHMGPMRDGTVAVGVVCVSQDVTELKQAQLDFAAAHRLAAVGTLAAGIAHEINTPVQFVSDSVLFVRDAVRDVFAVLDSYHGIRRNVAEGGLDVAAAIAASERAEQEADLPYLADHVPKALDRCVEGLAQIAAIAGSMKEFAHPAQREMFPVDLNRAIQSTVAVARNEYKYVAELETEFGELPPVMCHVNDINQVVLNLLINAAHAIGDVVKGTDHKGTIRLRTRQDGDHAVIAIRDTGGGIPDAIAHRIFEPFFTTKPVGRGTGQGLALAWSVVREKHGGELSFETAVGEGTTFEVRLPIEGRQAKRDAHGRGS